MSAPACPEHRDLVGRVLGPAPSDDDLIRYADEVHACGRCGRELAIALRAHPKVLEQGGQSTADAAWGRLGERQQTAEGPAEAAPGWSLAAAVAVLLVVAAVTVLALI